MEFAAVREKPPDFATGAKARTLTHAPIRLTPGKSPSQNETRKTRLKGIDGTDTRRGVEFATCALAHVVHSYVATTYATGAEAQVRSTFMGFREATLGRTAHEVDAIRFGSQHPRFGLTWLPYSGARTWESS